MSEPRSPRSGSNAAAQTIALQSDRARSFGQARRHSYLVRFLKFVLPVVTVLSIGSYAAIFLLTSKLKDVKGLDVSAIRIDPKNLTMETPKYDGFGTDGSHYVIRAREAISDLRQTGPVRLNDIDGQITQPSGVVTNLKAVWGTFDQKKDILELYEKIDIDGSTGMKARLTRATIHTKESRIISPEPVYAETETGNIRALTMTMNSKAHQATFVGNVHVQLKANPAKPTNSTDAAAPKPKSGALPGLAANSGQPIEVKSEQLDVDDAAKTALFRRSVIARQGDAILQAPELDVLYEGKTAMPDGKKPAGKDQVDESATAIATTLATPAPAAEAQTKLKLIKARGGIVMTNKDDKVTAETLDYDAATDKALIKGNVVMTSINERRVTASQVDLDQKADTALITGNVVVVQGKNTMKGRQLFVDRKNGKTHLESPAEPGLSAARIQTVFYQNQATAQPGKTPAKADAKEPVAGGPLSFKTDPTQPIEIEAEKLDVFDLQKNAVYRGKVVAKQGDFVIQTVQMTAFYTGQSGMAGPGQPAAAKASPAKGPESATPAQLQRVEAREKVLVTGKDNQKAVADAADFDVKTNTIVLSGKVLVSQGPVGKESTVQGPDGSRLIIDMTSGISRFEQTPVASPAIGKSKPVIIASPVATGPASPTTAATSACPEGAICKTGRMRAVLYRNDVKDAAKKAVEKAGKEGETSTEKKPPKAAKPAASSTSTSAWESTTNSAVRP